MYGVNLYIYYYFCVMESVIVAGIAPPTNINVTMELQLNETYAFNVLGEEKRWQTDRGDYWIFKLELDGEYYSVRKHPYQHDRPFPEIAFCKVIGYFDNGVPQIIQDKYYLFKELYIVSSVHPFTIRSFETDVNTGDRYVALDDPYGFNHRLYNYDFRNIYKEGDTIECRIIQINPSCKINMKLIGNEDSFRGIFVSPELLFKSIGFSDQIQSCFYDLRKLEFEKTETNTFRFELKDVFEKYDDGQNLWIFSYINFLKLYFGYLARKEMLSKVREVSLIFFSIEKWLMDGSDFMLSNFGSEKLEQTRRKSEIEIVGIKAQLTALDILEQGSEGQFICEVEQELRTTGYLEHKEETFEILCKVLFLSNDIYLRSFDCLCALTTLIATADGLFSIRDKSYLETLIYHKAEQEINYLSSNLERATEPDITREKMITLLKTLYYLIVFQRCNVDSRVETRKYYHRKAQFYKLLGYLVNPDTGIRMLRLAVKSLVGQLDDDSLFTWETAKSFDMEKIVAATLKLGLKPAMPVRSSFNKGNGVLLLDSDGFYIFESHQLPTNLTHRKSLIRILCPFLNGDINISTMLQESQHWSNEQDLSVHAAQWNQLYERYQTPAPVRTPSIGEEILVEVKIQKKHPNLLFVRITDDRFDFQDGILHITNVSLAYIKDLWTLFHIGDSFYAKVIEYAPDRLQFGIKEQLSAFEESCPESKEISNRKKKFDQDYQYELIRAFVTPFAKQELISTESLEIDTVKELLSVVAAIARLESDPIAKYDYFNIAKLLASFCRDSRSYYFSILCRCMLERHLYGSDNKSALSDSQAEEEKKAFEIYPELADSAKVLLLLGEHAIGSKQKICLDPTPLYR